MERLITDRKKVILPTLLVSLLLVAGLLLTGYFYVISKLKPVDVQGTGVEKVFTVKKGDSTNSIANRLFEERLIKDPLVFRLTARLTGLDGSLKTGEFVVSSQMSSQDILKKLTSNEVVTYKFTIPEGFNLKQITELLVSKGYVDEKEFKEQLAKGNFKYDFLEGIAVGPQRLEGYLFPDTYEITSDMDEKAIVDMMLSRFAEEVDSGYVARVKQAGLTLHEAITLASIVEREAVKDEERPLVARVFLNRIEKGMKLESCATIQYALGENKQRLLYSDLKIESPYNTYKYKGLPPGPIGVPGQASLQSVVNPGEGDYLFFVVSEEGTHVFSKNLADHNKAKQKYVTRFQTP